MQRNRDGRSILDLVGRKVNVNQVFTAQKAFIDALQLTEVIDKSPFRTVCND